MILADLIAEVLADTSPAARRRRIVGALRIRQRRQHLLRLARLRGLR